MTWNYDRGVTLFIQFVTKCAYSEDVEIRNI